MVILLLDKKHVENISCIICNSEKTFDFFKVHNVPVNCNQLWDDQEDALNCARGDIKLTFCSNCGFIFNRAYQKNWVKYNDKYENSLFFSKNYQMFAENLTKRLINKYSLFESNIIEIGFGKSNFLELFCKIGNNHGLGFDPTYKQFVNRNPKKNINIIPDFYSEVYKDHKADLIFSWHVLEHISNPNNFISTIRRAINDKYDTHLFFGVPNSLHNFANIFIWDIIYEHYSYFTRPSLHHIFRSNGFKVIDIYEDHEGQSLCIEALPSKSYTQSSTTEVQKEITQISNYILSFSNKYPKKINDCNDKIKPLIDDGLKAVIWGAGSRGVTFLNTLKNLQIDYAVDINPRKQGMYIPGTGQKIVTPKFLTKYQPDIVIIMNPIYEDEIRVHSQKLDIHPTYILV